MMQLNYDEIRLLRELKNSERKAAGNKLDVGLERLVKEGYATTFHPNVSETILNHNEGLGCVARFRGERLERRRSAVAERGPPPVGEE